MIVETATAIAWLKVGAAGVAGAAVKEVTKDAYTALKKKVLSVLGAKSQKIWSNRLEKDPNKILARLRSWKRILQSSMM